MNFYRSKRFWTGAVVGVVISFLFAQPFLLIGFYGLKQLLLKILPASLVAFIWDHTLVTFLFLWFLVPLAAGYWFYRGEYMKHEDLPEDLSSEPSMHNEEGWRTVYEDDEEETTIMSHERFNNHP